jgi:hypothetical protein
MFRFELVFQTILAKPVATHLELTKRCVSIVAQATMQIRVLSRFNGNADSVYSGALRTAQHILSIVELILTFVPIIVFVPREVMVSDMLWDMFLHLRLGLRPEVLKER